MTNVTHPLPMIRTEEDARKAPCTCPAEEEECVYSAEIGGEGDPHYCTCYPVCAWYCARDI